MLKEFKEFALKGNMLDMAIGIIIGAAFGTVISSLVNDLLMPVISGIIGTPSIASIASREWLVTIRSDFAALSFARSAKHSPPCATRS